MIPVDDKRLFIRHTVATVAYRAAKVLRTFPEHAQELKIGDTTRTPAEILAHVGDLFDWALWLASGEGEPQNSTPLPWVEGVERFFASLAKFDAYLASERPLNAPTERLFQGPIADSLTHIGQLSMLSRVAGTPVRGENYFKAEIAAGRVSPDQPQAVREFD